MRYFGLLLLACMMPAEASWFLYRNNGLQPIPLHGKTADSQVVRAMAVITTGSGLASQAIQVCPGVYLATAHGVLMNPRKPRARAYHTLDKGVKIYPYPFRVGKYFTTQNAGLTVYAPRVKNVFNWLLHDTDFAFIKMNLPRARLTARRLGMRYRVEDYVIPLAITTEQLIAQDQPVYLYRNQSLYPRKGAKGLPYIHQPYQRTLKELEQLLTLPRKTRAPCQLIESQQKMVGHDCPFEQGASGSTLIVKKGDKPYVAALAAYRKGFVGAGLARPLDAGNANDAIAGAGLCELYEHVCGVPCAGIE
jgi:hypothetical protein